MLIVLFCIQYPHKHCSTMKTENFFFPQCTRSTLTGVFKNELETTRFTFVVIKINSRLIRCAKIVNLVSSALMINVFTLLFLFYRCYPSRVLTLYDLKVSKVPKKFTWWVLTKRISTLTETHFFVFYLGLFVFCVC